MSRRLSAIRFASRLRNLPDPTEAARVVAVWESIRRLHGAPPEQPGAGHSLHPTEDGIALAKDVWLLGAGLTLLLDDLLDRCRR